MRLLKGNLLILLVTLVYFSYFSNAHHHIELVTTQTRHPGLHSRHKISGFDCLSWRLAVETNNLRNWGNWGTIPENCKDYVEDYMVGTQYRMDTSTVVAIARDYVESLRLNNDGKDVWIFDIDDTCISTVPYIFGENDPTNGTALVEWLAEGNARAILPVRRFYQILLRLGVKVVFLTGMSDAYRESRERNMRKLGFHTWEFMILRNVDELSLSQLEYKTRRRAELVTMGYRIVGNMGDQWTDLLGPHPGLRTFKIPNPMYYAP